jgi:hypothetical protein
MAKKSHGGKRSNAGRKPVEDPKITFTIYPRQSIIDLIGVQAAKELALAALEREAKKIQKR